MDLSENKALKNKLILVDLDGTLIRGDSLLRFLWFTQTMAGFAFHWLQALPAILSYSLGVISSDRGKERVLQIFFRGWEQEKLLHMGLIFARTTLQKRIRKEFLNYLNKEKASGARIVLVSASPDVYVEEFARTLGFEAICTRIRKKGPGIGSLETPNCKGEEKVRRIKEFLTLLNYENIEAYGDSRHDLPMVALANTKGFTDSSFL